MPFKTTSYLAAHYPNTYMEQFCKALHPDLEMGAICVAWFRQATKHCTNMLSDARPPTAYFWTTFKNFIFPDRSTEIISQKVSINIHPKRLSMRDCQSLFLDIVGDYVQRAPRYSAESTTNVMLWQVLYSFLGIIVLGSLLIGIICAYNKYDQPKKVINFIEEVFRPEKRMQAIAKRSLHLCKTELRNIRIKPLAKTEDIAAADGVGVLAVKVGTKYDFLKSIVGLKSEGKFFKHFDHYTTTSVDTKIESFKKAMKFLDNNCKKLHLLLMFEDDACFEEELTARKFKSNDSRRKMISPRTLNLSSKGRLDGGNAPHKATIAPLGTGTRCSSPRVASTKQTITPRSSPTLHSSAASSTSIPRNVQKRPTIAKRSN